MGNIKLTIEYDGSRYKGWQKLGDNERTIQGKIESVLSKMTGEKIELIGSGRTDAGVHAYNQIANFHTETNIDTVEIQNYLYQYLPEDIVVKKVENTEDKFHARFHAKGKKYMYRIDNNKFHSPFHRKYSYHISDILNVEAMRKGADFLVGKHNFSSFTSLKNKKKSYIREIYSIDIDKKEQFIDIIYYGDGFLYNMIRIITGTLIDVGLSVIPHNQVEHILLKQDRSVAGATVPPQGLFLLEVLY